MSIPLGNKGNQKCNGDLVITQMGSGAWNLHLLWTLESVPLPLYGVFILACFPAKDQKAKLEGAQNW